MRLEAAGLSVRFSATDALAGVSLAAARGERIGLVGPNGAGKTTLLDVIGGRIAPAAGHVELGGQPLTGLRADQVARLGVARTFQSPRLFARMTVEENVRASRALDPEPWLRAVGLEARRRDLAGALTAGEARRLELARALAGDPRLLLLDEPCGGLTPAETEAMIALIVGAAAPTRVVIVVEHKLDVVARLCPRAVVLSAGEKIFDGPTALMRTAPRVLAAYLGAARRP